MTLVRSDEAPTSGGLIDLETLHELAKDWYGDRLDPDWRPRTAEQSQAILDRHLGGGEFWSLT
jgi:hypothetical protein